MPVSEPSYVKHYTARAAGGWMMVVQAPNQREATRIARELVETASLLPSDVQSVTPSTPEDMDWYASMGGNAR